MDSATYNPILSESGKQVSTRSSNGISEEDSKPPGCLVTVEDYPHILGSCACFITFLVYGACLGSLGAALPSLAIKFNQSEEECGLAFTSRGIGYFLGTIGSAALIEIKCIKLPLLHLTCASIFLVGLATGGLSLASEFNVSLGIFGIQGIGAGGVDTFGNCYLPQVWGKRVGPWMQCMHSFFGLGAIVGPTLVGSVGYVETFVILCLLSVIPGCVVLTYDSTAFIKACFSFNRDSSVTSISTGARNEPARKPRRREGYGKLSQSTADVNEDSDFDHASPTESRQRDEKYNSAEEGFGVELLPVAQEKSDHRHSDGRESVAPDRSHYVSKTDDNDDDLEVIHLSVRTDNPSANNLSTRGDKAAEHTADTETEGEVEGQEMKTPEAPVPAWVRTLLLIFFAVYVGIETSYGGWITTYALEQNVTASKENAAYVASAYWSALTAGRVLAIPLAVYVSTTRLMRVQLSMCVVSSLLVLFLASINYNCIIFVSICFGYSLSSMFPLAMTLPTDYGYTLDATTTTLFVVGATLGEGIFPIAVGFLMDAFGSSALTYSMVAFSVSIAALYSGAHMVALRNPPQRGHIAVSTTSSL